MSWKVPFSIGLTKVKFSRSNKMRLSVVILFVLKYQIRIIGIERTCGLITWKEGAQKIIYISGYKTIPGLIQQLYTIVNVHPVYNFLYTIVNIYNQYITSCILQRKHFSVTHKTKTASIISERKHSKTITRIINLTWFPFQTFVQPTESVAQLPRLANHLYCSHI